MADRPCSLFRCACDREPKGVLKEDVLILITGATGHVGRGVANILSERNVRLRILGRDLSRLPQIGAECVAADYDDPQSLEHAFEGIVILLDRCHRIDDRFKVTDRTKNILKISLSA